MAEEYKTKDVHEAAYLWSLADTQYEKAERTGGRVWFAFTSKTGRDMSPLIDEYHARKATVEPKTFAQRLSDIRDILFKFRNQKEKE